jgi:hypothetical protein
VVAVTPENEEVSAPSVTEALPLMAQATPAPEPAAPAPAELPKTASPLPVLGLMGFGSLGVAIALKAVARRIA